MDAFIACPPHISLGYQNWTVDLVTDQPEGDEIYSTFILPQIFFLVLSTITRETPKTKEGISSFLCHQPPFFFFFPHFLLPFFADRVAKTVLHSLMHARVQAIWQPQKPDFSFLSPLKDGNFSQCEQQKMPPNSLRFCSLQGKKSAFSLAKVVVLRADFLPGLPLRPLQTS